MMNETFSASSVVVDTTEYDDYLKAIFESDLPDSIKNAFVKLKKVTDEFLNSNKINLNGAFVPTTSKAIQDRYFEKLMKIYNEEIEMLPESEKELFSRWSENYENGRSNNSSI